MNRIRARWWMDARWQDKLTGSSVSLDGVLGVLIFSKVGLMTEINFNH